MRISKSLGLAGVGAAMGAVVMIPAAASAGTTYNSTATASAGSVTVGGNNVPFPDNSVTATDQSGPQAASLGVSALESALSSHNAAPIASSMKAALPNGADLVSETATAASNGKSTACAGFLLTGDCTMDGKSQPLTLSLSLADLPGLPTPPAGGANQPASSQKSQKSQSPQLLPSSDAPAPLRSPLSKLGGAVPGNNQSQSSTKSQSGSSSAPSTPLSAFTIVVTLTGPQAACTAGPDGSSGANFTATQSLASASLDILQSGKSVLPSGPIALKSGDILSQVPTSLPAPLSSLPSASPIDLTINPGSTSGVGSGPSTTATAGELGLSAQGNQVLDLKGAQAKCGPNKAAVAASKPPAKTTSSEKPLGGGIQTDEGHSGSGSDPALWAGVAGAAALGGTASGLTLWRRRRNAL